MANIPFVPDEYTWRARVAPSLLTALPAAFAVLALSLGSEAMWNSLYGLVVAAGGTFFLAQLARRLGSMKEPELWRRLGGRPSENMLSHVKAPNPIILSQRQGKLALLMPGIHLPSADDERRDAKAANDVYNACVTELIGRTRDKVKYRLLFEENCNFGFGRNLWGLKPLGILIALLASIVLGGSLAVQLQSHQHVSWTPVVLEALNVAWVGGWLAFVNPELVRPAANRYAERLLEALDTM